MATRPRLVATGLAAVSLVTLTGCEKPTPLVSLVSGGTSVHTEALAYCFEGQDPGAEGSCSTYPDVRPKVLEVTPGEQVGIDVDKELADAGWFVEANGERSAVQDGHYFAFTPQNFGEQGRIQLRVRSLERPADDAQPTGLWAFELVPAS